MKKKQKKKRNSPSITQKRRENHIEIEITKTSHSPPRETNRYRYIREVLNIMNQIEYVKNIQMLMFPRSEDKADKKTKQK